MKLARKLSVAIITLLVGGVMLLAPATSHPAQAQTAVDPGYGGNAYNDLGRYFIWSQIFTPNASGAGAGGYGMDNNLGRYFIWNGLFNSPYAANPNDDLGRFFIWSQIFNPNASGAGTGGYGANSNLGRYFIWNGLFNTYGGLGGSIGGNAPATGGGYSYGS